MEHATARPLDYLSQFPEIVTGANTRHSGAPKPGWPCCLFRTLTATFDYAPILFVRIYPGEKVISDFDKRKNAVSTNVRLQLEVQAVLDAIQNPNVPQPLRQDKTQNLQYLKGNHNISSQLQYFFGNYTGAADYLYHFHVLSTENDLNNPALG